MRISRALKLMLAFTFVSHLMYDYATGAEQTSLVQRLGYEATDRLLIINGDDAGMCHSANLATIECMEKGLMRSATVMVPCPWFPEIAQYATANPQKSFGVHLTHTSEWTGYKWGPLAPKEQVRGLVTPEGYFWRGVQDVYANATPEQALVEGRAQIRQALDAGIDVTHIDSHMGTLQLHPGFVQTYLRLAVEFNLPARMASQETLARMGYPRMRGEFAAKGIISPDYFVYEELKDEKADVRSFWLKIVKNLKPGVTELYIHAGLPNDELKAITGSWSTRAEEYEVFTHDREMKQAIESGDIKLISYRPLRDLQRKLRSSTTGSH